MEKKIEVLSVTTGSKPNQTNHVKHFYNHKGIFSQSLVVHVSAKETRFFVSGRKKTQTEEINENKRWFVLYFCLMNITAYQARLNTQESQLNLIKT